jgi:hypothetical protein
MRRRAAAQAIHPLESFIDDDHTSGRCQAWLISQLSGILSERPIVQKRRAERAVETAVADGNR